MAPCEGGGDGPAKGLADHRGSLDAEGVERADELIGPEREAVVEGLVPLAEAHPVEVERDHAMARCERIEDGALPIEGRASRSVDQQHGRPLAALDEVHAMAVDLHHPPGDVARQGLDVVALAERSPAIAELGEHQAHEGECRQRCDPTDPRSA